MKKILALVLALVMVLSLAACGGQSGNSGSAGGDAQTSGGDAQTSGGDAQTSGGSDLPGAGMKIGLVCDRIGVNPFLTEMVRGLNETAETYGFTPTVVECADNAAFEDNIRALAAEAGLPATDWIRFPKNFPTPLTMF